MKKFFNTLGIILTVFFIAQAAFAEEYKVLVLPDNLQFESTNYYVFPDASVIFASDTINNLRKSGGVETVSMSQIRDVFRKNLRLQLLAKGALKEFKYNNNVSFVDLKNVTRSFGTNKVLIITSTTDVQNYFLRRTIWDLLNVPGAAVVDPAYSISTYVALVDVDKEIVLWQRSYQKILGAEENRMVAVGFAPASQQLDRIKSYSEYFLSPEIARMVENKILPPPVTSVNANIVTSDGKAIKTPLSEIHSTIETEIKTKPFAPIKPRVKSSEVFINDL